MTARLGRWRNVRPAVYYPNHSGTTLMGCQE